MRSKSEADVLLEWIDQYLVPREQAICEGSADSYAQYREACGIITGMRMVRKEIARRKKLYETED
jgi:hypothetical protein